MLGRYIFGSGRSYIGGILRALCIGVFLEAGGFELFSLPSRDVQQYKRLGMHSLRKRHVFAISRGHKMCQMFFGNDFALRQHKCERLCECERSCF